MDTFAIYENCDTYTAFPDSSDLFSSDYENEVMLPLGIFAVDVDGTRHEALLAVPTISHRDGIIGCANFGEYCGELWMSYTKINGKWNLDCLSDELCDLENAPAIVKGRYEERKALFKKFGCMPLKGDINRKLPLLEFGAKVNEYSRAYSHMGEYVPNTVYDDPEEMRHKYVIFESTEGGEFLRLGSLTGWVYCGLYGDFVFFYNPEIERVLVSVEYD